MTFHEKKERKINRAKWTQMCENLVSIFRLKKLNIKMKYKEEYFSEEKCVCNFF